VEIEVTAGVTELVAVKVELGTCMVLALYRTHSCHTRMEDSYPVIVIGSGAGVTVMMAEPAAKMVSGTPSEMVATWLACTVGRFQ